MHCFRQPFRVSLEMLIFEVTYWLLLFKFVLNFILGTVLAKGVSYSWKIRVKTGATATLIET